MSKASILVVGDLHGEWGKLNQLISKKQPDIVLQCGDFGWWPKMEIKAPVLYGHTSKWRLKGIKPGNSKIYWCDGNHEELPHLIQDGNIHEMYNQVFHGSRGSTLRLPDGRIVLFAGGASSVDKDLRTPGHDWFFEENITNKEFELMLSHKRVDVVVSHTCPTQFEVYGTGSTEKLNDGNRIALSYVLEKYKPSLWFFGHWHNYEYGKFENTKWFCLDYPGHRSRWWMWCP